MPALDIQAAAPVGLRFLERVAHIGDNEIVAAVSGRRIRVYSYVVVASADVSITWKSGATSISGAMALVANGGISAHMMPATFLLQTAAGGALVLNLGGNMQVSGHLSYWDDDS